MENNLILKTTTSYNGVMRPFTSDAEAIRTGHIK